MASNVAVIEVDDVGVRGPPGTGGGGGSSGFTIDTNELYRIIMLSNGSVFAIPFDAVPPDKPTGLAASVRLTSVNLTWTPAARATSYIIRRNGVELGSTWNLSYRDINIVAGNTYTYTVSSVDQYKQRSPASDPVSAFIDIALNVAPTNVVIRCWPLPIPTDGPALIRVNGRDVDVQEIAYTLGVDAGSLAPTADPTIWVFRI